VDMRRMDRFGVWHVLMLLPGGALLLLAIVAIVAGELDS